VNLEGQDIDTAAQALDRQRDGRKPANSQLAARPVLFRIPPAPPDRASLGGTVGIEGIRFGQRSWMDGITAQVTSRDFNTVEIDHDATTEGAGQLEITDATHIRDVELATQTDEAQRLRLKEAVGAVDGTRRPEPGTVMEVRLPPV